AIDLRGESLRTAGEIDTDVINKMVGLWGMSHDADICEFATPGKVFVPRRAQFRDDLLHSRLSHLLCLLRFRMGGIFCTKGEQIGNAVTMPTGRLSGRS